MSCGGDSGTDPIVPPDNRPPQILALTITPTTVAAGEKAAVILVASDPDGDNMTASATASHGTVSLGTPVAAASAASASAEKVLQWTGSYTGTSEGEDAIAVTVSDGKGQTASSTSSPLKVWSEPAPPTVTVSCDPTSCHPSSSSDPCTSTCTAVATDANADPLTYRWSGCTDGEETTVTCTVKAIRVFTARVVVSDGNTAPVTATATVEGGNAPPDIFYLGTNPDPPGPAADFRVKFRVDDADIGDPITGAEGELVWGPCSVVDAVRHDGWFEIIVRPSGPGPCRLRARSRDGWMWGWWEEISVVF